MISSDAQLMLTNGSFGFIIAEINGVEGFVCAEDEDAFQQNNNVCEVVCRQLGFME